VARSDNPACYEEDHLISLENGGDPKDPKNLWPEPYNTKVGATSFSLLLHEGPEGAGVELEFHQLALRYERLKVVRPEPERRPLGSLAEVGQQVPIMVVKEDADGPFVVIDGYKRVRALRRLGRDTVAAGCWPGGEAEALIATHLVNAALLVDFLNRFSWVLGIDGSD